MFVYFIQDGKGKGGYIKIGKAKNIKNRLESLQIGNPRKLTLMAAIRCKTCKEALKIEKELHHRFRKHHIRGEWYDGFIELNTVRESFDVEPQEI